MAARHARKKRPGALGLSTVADRLIDVAEMIDERWRYLDMDLNRSDDQGSLQRRFPVLGGHAPAVILLMLVAFRLLVHGPLFLRFRGVPAEALTLCGGALLLAAVGLWGRRGAPALSLSLARWRAWACMAPWIVWMGWATLDALGFLNLSWEESVLMVIAGVLSVLAATAATPRGTVGMFAFVLFAAAAATVWWALDSEEREAPQTPYRHIFTPLVLLVLFLALTFNRWWAWFLFRDHRPRYRSAFRTQLSKTQLFDPGIASRAAGTDIIRAYIAVPVLAPLQLVTVPAIVALTSRRENMMLLTASALVLWWMFMAMVVFQPRLDALFSLVSRLLVQGGSLVVSLCVMGLALGRVLEIDYVTTLLDSGAQSVIRQYLLALYGMAWIYDYWSDRALCEVLLGFLHPQDDAPQQIAYTPPKDAHGRPCWLQPHGTRFLAWREPGDGNGLHFNAWLPQDLFRSIAASSPVESDSRRSLPFLLAQMRFHRVVPAILGVALVAWFGKCLLDLPREPHVVLDRLVAAPTSLTSLLASPPGTPRQDVLLVAASGGGTRAALHTKTVLEALHRHGRLQDVALVSGVSGGSLAAAYFAAFRPRLLRDPPGKGQWENFHQAMIHPHIQRVLEGAFEWRLATGTRLGALLRESFDGFLLGSRKHLGDTSDVGVIFNTTLVGETRWDTPEARPESQAGEAGGRLVFTNLAELGRLRVPELPPGKPRRYPAEFPFVTSCDGSVTLSAAASASANFPPVFSDLPIRMTEGPITRQFWVTDGGAMENRGALSILLALREVAKDPATRLPRIRLLVADASAFSVAFRQGRGLGAVAAAPRRLADKLIAELLTSVREAVEARQDPSSKGLFVHDLTLPDPLRVSGSFGTHWMMPAKVTVAPKNQPHHSVDLDAAEIVEVFRQLFLPGERVWPHAELEAWIRESDPRPSFLQIPKGN